MWLTALTVVISSPLACQTGPGVGPRPATARVGKLSGLATWYGGKRWHGRLTASGQIFDQDKLTAAHKRLPFGTLVRVKNLKNGRTVTVRITDRGPYGKGRIIDVSRAGAKRLGMLVAGVVPVKLTVLKWGQGRKKGWRKIVQQYKARQRRLRRARQRRRARRARRLLRLRRRCRLKRYRQTRTCRKLRRARPARPKRRKR
jgi:peptidoglycan lytic transglycosylase